MKTSRFRTGILPAFALAFAAGCVSSIDQLSITRSWVDARNGIHAFTEEDGLTRKAVYYSLVEFPSDYDWQRDSAFGAVDCTIHLMRDSVEVLSFPAGKGRGISPEADTHFIFDGHIYTVYAVGGRTVVCRDGERLFSYEGGQERLRGFAAWDDGVYCLSQGADALVLRRDGIATALKEEAVVIGRLDESPTDPYGALYVDRGELCFAYSKKGAFYLAHGDEVQKLDLPDFVPEVKRVRRIDGTIYYIGVKADEVAVCAPEIPLAATHFGSVPESELYLGSCAGMPFLTCTYARGNEDMVDFCNPLLRLMRERCIAFYPMGMRGELTCLMVTQAGLKGCTRDGGEFSLEGMRLPTVRCCAYADGLLRLALVKGGRGFLWVGGSPVGAGDDGGVLREVGCNGYISCMAVEP